jgi:ketosteroid isomerase-like protein
MARYWPGMSQENAEIVRRIYERLNRGDVEGVVELCDDDLLIDMSERVFNPDTYTGPDGIRRFYEGVGDAWESYRWDVEETRVVGDSVVAMLHCHAQSREGGPEVDWRVAWLWKLRRRKPVSVRFYRHRADALQAAGLSE